MIGSLPEFSPVIKATLTLARADLGEGGEGGSGIFLKIQTYQIRIVKLPKIGLRPIWQTKLLSESPTPRGIFSGSAHAESYKVTI